MCNVLIYQIDYTLENFKNRSMVKTRQAIYVYAWLDGKEWIVLNVVPTGSARIKTLIQWIQMETQE